ncbi:MAG: U32 family peptidase [Coriobacteriia bacterium]|nr:U32 family peptidase [Coriobacteriia bacterium]
MIKSKKIELLAPAGNMTCLHAAITAGADAVYLGLNHFNARRGADNFTIETLKEACDYAHLRGRKIYLTLNIIVFEREIQQALDLAIDAANAGVDAFIVQDIGLARLIKKYIPDVRLHISTQMNVHNEDGVNLAKDLGADRITLARELSLSQIEDMCKHDIEIECFAHGALCICYSGQCLMSSMIGGRSANRGTCAQACRLEYSLPGVKDSYLLSPKDLCTIDCLEELVDAGVKSLKIEGRMKSPEYVYSVVSVYRKALDNNYQVTKEDKNKLEEVFSRGFSEAYIKNKRGNEIMSYKRPNNRGVNIGRVNAVDKTLKIKTKTNLHKGDVLEVWTSAGRATFVYDNLKLDFKNKEHRSIRVGDRVFRVRNTEYTFTDDAHKPKIKVDAVVDIYLGKKIKLTLNSVCAEGNIVETARTKSITEDEVIKHIDRFGGTDFELNNIQVNLDHNVGLSFSELHHLRQEAVEKLKIQFRRNIKKVKLNKRKNISKEKEIEICALCTNPDVARRVKADKIYIPKFNYKRGTATYAGCSTDQISQANYPKKINILPPLIRNEHTDFDELDPHVPVVNNYTVDYFKSKGIKRIWLSPELSLDQIKDITLKHTDISFGLYVLGRQELMVTKHCILMSMGECKQECSTCPRRMTLHCIEDRKGYKFPVMTDIEGRSHIYNSIQLDVSYCIDQLKEAGVDAFMVDTTFMTMEEAAQAVGKVMSGVKDKLKHTTTGHLFREVL